MRQLSILVTLAAAVAVIGGCASGVDAGGGVEGSDGPGENDQPGLDAIPVADDPDLLSATSSTTSVERVVSDPLESASTTVAAESATAPAAGPAGRSSDEGSDDEMMAMLADALSSSDLCEVYAALDSLTVRGSDLHDLSHTLDVVAATLHASDQLVPESLADSWRELEHELDRARSELAKPHAERQTVVDIFDAPEFAEAHGEIEVWREANCA